MRRPSSWAAIAAASVAMYASRAKTLRRAALRGALAAAVTRVVLLPTGTGSHIDDAVAAAYVTGVGVEEPIALPALAALVVAARGEGNLPSPKTAGAAAAGVAIAAASTRVWPVPPRSGPIAPRVQLPARAEPNPDGGGLTIVVNAASGGDDGADDVEHLRRLLPRAEVRAVDPEQGDELRKALDEAASAGAVALGVSGGDGSINTAAQVALEAGKPLMVIPGGTFNHLTQAVGVDTLEDSVAAVREGEAVEMDVASIGGHVFLNTASFGSYVELVDTRQRLEKRIGKWPAMVLALIRVLRHSEPIEVEIDDVRSNVWMAFIGNCRYHPSGFAPSWRERLDDGLLDVRYVSGEQPWARTRLVLAILTGRLGRSKVYRQTHVERLRLRGLRGPLRLARDGETFEGPEDVVVEKLPKRLVVFAPHENHR